MRHETLRYVGMATTLCALLLATPGMAQYREYYLRGRVLDTQKEPIPGVEIRLHDGSTSRSYQMKTDKKGVYKLAGLPHGVYEVTVAKEGYSPMEDEWDFATPQDKMRRVELPDIVLGSQSQVREAQRLGEADAGVKEAGERLRKGDLDGAITLLQGVLDENPDDANALFFIGLGYARKKMHPEAIAALTRVTELNPAFPGAYFELGVCHRELGDLPKALEYYEKTTQLDPTNADSAYNSGLILFQTNRVDEALSRFETGLASKPEDPELQEMVGRCHLHEGKFEAAVEHLERARAATTDPDKVALLDELIAQTKAMIP